MVDRRVVDVHCSWSVGRREDFTRHLDTPIVVKGNPIGRCEDRDTVAVVGAVNLSALLARFEGRGEHRAGRAADELDLADAGLCVEDEHR